MTTATIGERYQVVIPAPERKQLHLKPHQQVSFEYKDDYLIVRPLGARSYRGIAQDVKWDEDAVDYVTKIRNEWNQRS